MRLYCIKCAEPVDAFGVKVKWRCKCGCENTYWEDPPEAAPVPAEPKPGPEPGQTYVLDPAEPGEWEVIEDTEHVPHTAAKVIKSGVSEREAQRIAREWNASHRRFGGHVAAWRRIR